MPNKGFRKGNKKKIFGNRIQVTFSNVPEFFVIDRCDEWSLEGRTWMKATGGYPICYDPFTPKKRIYLHRLLIEAPENKHVDHKNGITWNNRKSNLRTCSISENHYNRSAFNTKRGLPIGVYFDKSRGKYLAMIKINRKQKNLGRFDSISEAQAASEAARTVACGEFSPYRNRR